MSNFDVPKEAPPVSVLIVYPTAEVKVGRWVTPAGAQSSVAGSRARGIARQNFGTREVAAVTAGSLPAPSLALTILGFETAECGADNIPDNSIVTTDNQGRSVVASNANDEQLGFMPKGGSTGDLRPVFVFRNDATRAPAAAFVDLTGTFGAVDGAIEDVGGAFNQGILNNNFNEVRTAINAILARLRLQKTIA